MVLAEDIEILSTFTAEDLTEGIRITGYKVTGLPVPSS